MKIFLSTFAALLLAGAIFIALFFAYIKFVAWEQEKNEAMARTRSEIVAADYFANELRTLSPLMSAQTALDIAIERANIAREGTDSLKETLERKPFFLPLTAEEKKLLQDAIASVKAEQETISTFKPPTPTPPQVSHLPALAKITLAQPVVVQAQYGSTTLPIGTEVELVSQDASSAHIRYAGRELIIPSSAVTQSK
jgi:hypothetical protein